jgi:methionyl-tRNA synthetase
MFVNNNNAAFMTTGTDEHGLKVEQAARAAGKDPKTFVDLTAESFKELADTASICYDRFIRTTDDDHVRASQHLWNVLMNKGYIYKGNHSGWYCVSDETFYPESQVQKHVDDVTGTTCVLSKATGKKVEWTSEENYFFALSKMREPLLQHLRQNKQFIIPEQRWRYIEREVDLGLDDLSISRPRARCSWGIVVPGDDTQVMYVWLEALANYLTSAGYPWTTDQEYAKSCWPADAHVIGKDILRFHGLYWPAFLLAAGIPPPKQVVVHSHWTIEGSKMSKSTGNVVDPIYSMEMFGVDSVKYFLANDGYLDHDSPFSNARILSRHNTNLVNRYGNLVTRTCGYKFNIHRSLTRDAGQIIQENLPSSLLDRHSILVNETNTLLSRVDSFMNKYDPARGLGQVWNLINLANVFLQDSAPWIYTREDTTHIQDAIVKDAAEVARVTSIVLTPFIPEIANTMLHRLEVAKNKRSREFAAYGTDISYGVGANRKGDYPIAAIGPR